MRTRTKNRILGCRAAGYIANVHGACTHPYMFSSVECYRRGSPSDLRKIKAVRAFFPATPYPHSQFNTTA